MDDTLDLGVLLEHALEGLHVAAVNLLKSRTNAGNLLDTIHYICV